MRSVAFTGQRRRMRCGPRGARAAVTAVRPVHLSFGCSPVGVVVARPAVLATLRAAGSLSLRARPASPHVELLRSGPRARKGPITSDGLRSYVFPLCLLAPKVASFV